jgi:hypothetical protein
MIVCAFGHAGAAQPPPGAVSSDAAARPQVQVLDGEATPPAFRLYRIRGLQEGQTLSVNVTATSGNLDPMAALLRPEADPQALASPEELRSLVDSLSQDRPPTEVSREILQRHALAWNDDYQGYYHAAFSTRVPEDGEYLLAVGSSLVRPSAGSYRLTVGIEAPDVLSGAAEERGLPFVTPVEEAGAREVGIESLTGELKPGQDGHFYHLAELPANHTFYAYAERVSGDLRPELTLFDQSDKPLAYGNFLGSEPRAVLEYRLPRESEGYRLWISGKAASGAWTSGEFRLLLGLNAQEVRRGEGRPRGRALSQEPIPVGIGVKLQQITQVDQKATNFGAAGTLAMHWRDPALAFNPSEIPGRFKVFTGDAFAAEMTRQGRIWPQFTIVNQQGERWVQNRVVVIRPDGETAYLERFSTTLQAPDFDFRDFPFDVQRFFIQVDLLTPEWMFVLRDIEGYSEVGGTLGEEEWVITGFDTSFAKSDVLNRPVSRFNFEFSAKRHIAYYFFRILLPLTVIITVSWILFFLKDYAKRVDAAGANLLLFIAFNFAISNDLPRLGYLTFLDTLLISAFLVTAVVLILSVYLRRQDMQGRQVFVAKVDRYVITFYPLAYLGTIGVVTFVFS